MKFYMCQIYLYLLPKLTAESHTNNDNNDWENLKMNAQVRHINCKKYNN